LLQNLWNNDVISIYFSCIPLGSSSKPINEFRLHVLKTNACWEESHFVQYPLTEGQTE